ncbi:polyketide cyclase [Pandoraea thiooxydans]|uniref:Polyketide cyclase n=1 Tax=Pandoraea thiooxydans TaxID=445709 RepID=A0A0G3ELX2_9BURK|nr:SRPBCC family protein [Pandoraea thiooxydans]AKJ67940.1 polyketide cyclase [Pandoraea thiooxydans]APR95150.1 polyketide cyclase [Pandoraea thiooxydans]
MQPTAELRTLTVSIDRPWREVYDFAADPQSFKRWASGLGQSLQRVGQQWFADGPEGRVTIRFAERNDFGVLDHYVRLASGEEIYVPMRVVANGDGCTVMFTLLRSPGMSEATFARDAQWVERDLQALKRLFTD